MAAMRRKEDQFSHEHEMKSRKQTTMANEPNGRPPIPDFLKNLGKPQHPPMLQLIGPIPPGFVGQPLPMFCSTDNGTTSDGHPLVIMQMSTPAGVQFYFMSPDTAEQVAEGIMKAVRGTRSGLVVVDGERTS